MPALWFTNHKLLRRKTTKWSRTVVLRLAANQVLLGFTS